MNISKVKWTWCCIKIGFFISIFLLGGLYYHIKSTIYRGIKGCGCRIKEWIKEVLIILIVFGLSGCFSIAFSKIECMYEVYQGGRLIDKEYQYNNKAHGCFNYSQHGTYYKCIECKQEIR